MHLIICSINHNIVTHYYFKFNKQRLAHDLVGSICLTQINATQLYYCFQNIKEFTQKVANLTPPLWEEIDKQWQTQQRFTLNSDELIDLSTRYLDLLASLS